MPKEPNLKEIERKTYISYHQDGLLDIFAALYILGFGIGILMNVIWDFSFGVILPGMLVAVVLPLWIAAKRKITMPRIGYVNFGTRGANKLVAVFTGLIVAGFAAFFALTISATQGGAGQWLDFIVQNGMLIVGAGALAICSLFGYSMGLKRLYAYGLLAAIAFIIGHFMGIFFAYITMGLGVTIMIAGFALLLTFIKKYPLKGEKTIVQ
jgi:hypothetical protein